jgi:hypothetical protein
MFNIKFNFNNITEFYKKLFILLKLFKELLSDIEYKFFEKALLNIKNKKYINFNSSHLIITLIEIDDNILNFDLELLNNQISKDKLDELLNIIKIENNIENDNLFIEIN